MDLKKEGLDMKTAIIKPEILEHWAVGIVHEIRNPLTTIKGFLQLLKPYLIEAGKEQYADVILDEINRTNEIVYEFLNSAKREINLSESISLNKILKDMVLLFESEAVLKNVAVITTLTNQDISLRIPANHLKQVLMNLMKNAMDAMVASHNRIIHISTNKDDLSASISMTDTGCGMTDEVIKSLFTPFYSTKEKGTGVGLCVCKQIIEDYGGSIHVNSIIGKGSTFIVTFPI